MFVFFLWPPFHSSCRSIYPWKFKMKTVNEIFSLEDTDWSCARGSFWLTPMHIDIPHTDRRGTFACTAVWQNDPRAHHKAHQRRGIRVSETFAESWSSGAARPSRAIRKQPSGLFQRAVCGSRSGRRTPERGCHAVTGVEISQIPFVRTKKAQP